MGGISRAASYAVASSTQENQQPQPCITCTTFNILAPIYKRLNHEVLLLLLFYHVFPMLPLMSSSNGVASNWIFFKKKFLIFVLVG